MFRRTRSLALGESLRWKCGIATTSTLSFPIDCRFSERDNSPFVEFSWEGESEMDPVCGRGWARLQDAQLKGQIYIHNGDDSAFVAAKQK